IFRRVVFHGNEPWSNALQQFRNGTGPGADAGAQIVQAIANDPDGIGISNLHYATPAVKPLSVTTADHPALIAPTRENVASRTYPLTRAVYMVVDPETMHSNPAVREFLRYVLSEQGRQAVAKEGEYLPLSPEVAARELGELAGR
ncbi:MAG TPA: substrate-binding domain-containing protein, partial [Acidobacteriaceae bacterium]|nr:substrate-binding domain-containing protein [Acidobacteriaceae bacterium]